MGFNSAFKGLRWILLSSTVLSAGFAVDLGSFICVGQDRLSLGNGQSPHGHINQRLQIQFRAPDDDRCAAQNMLILQKTLE